MSTDNSLAQPAPDRELPVNDPDPVYSLIDTHADELDLPARAVETATDLFAQAYRENSLVGRGSRIGVAAAIRVACQQHTVPRSLDEIAAVTESDTKLIAREARKIQYITGQHTTPVDPRDYVDHWADKLNVVDETRRKAVDLLDDVNPSRAPSAAAAGVLWAALAPRDENITQSDIAEATQISAYALREVQNDVTKY